MIDPMVKHVLSEIPMMDDAPSGEEYLRAEIARLQEQVEALTKERDRLREACRIARLHAPIIRLAPERRHTIAVLDAALQKEPQP